MKPINFAEANKTLGRPSHLTDDECGSLPVFADHVQTISLWRLTWRERFEVLFRGKIWLGVCSGSGTQPPVWMDTEKTVFSSDCNK
jgi:hypothetical protein